MGTPKKSKNKDSAENGATNGLEQSFAAAIRAAESSPESEDAWDHLEELADSLQRPEAVAELYLKVLIPNLPEDSHEQLVQRAIGFHEEWFGDNPQAMNAVLSRIIEIDPNATWAFERLTVVLTAAEEWDELLAMYDRTLASTEDKARLKQLLDDAANVAKDFANDLNRAVGYMQRLLSMNPGNSRLASSTERLLERLENWEALVAVWRGRLDAVSNDEARAIRLQVVACSLEHLNNPTQALDELDRILEESPSDEEACQLSERVLVFEDAPIEVRLRALGMLTASYDADKNPEAAVAALQKAIELVPEAERLPLHRDAAARLALLGKDDEAVDHNAKLLVANPGDPDARKQIRLLSARSSLAAKHAEALTAAADVCSEAPLKVALLVEAAQLHWDSLQDTDTAIDLYSQVIATEDIEQSTALTVAHNLNELLAAADRNEERLEVLERLAKLERASTVRKTILGQAAELAEVLGDTDKALAFWNKRLEGDIHDLEALGAVARQLEQNGRWDELIAALRNRTEAPIVPEQCRADLVRIAEIQAEYLQKYDDAVDTWLHILAEFGPQTDTLLALDGLMAYLGRWHELATLLEGAADSEYERAVALLGRVGDIQRLELKQIDRATRYYTQALSLDPTNAIARAGLSEIINSDEAPRDAADALARAYVASDDWALLLEIMDQRLKTVKDDTERSKILIEAAEIQDLRAGDPKSALGLLTRTFPLSPDDSVIEHEIMRLAEATDEWSLAAESCREAARAAQDIPERTADLRFAEGSILEEKIDDLQAAFEAYSRVVERDPTSPRGLHAAIRVAAKLGNWKAATESAVASTIARDRLEPPVFELLEATADNLSAWSELTAAMAEAVQNRDSLRADLARQLQTRIALWHRDRLEDLDAAEESARRAADHDLRHQETLSLLASLQRRAPGPALVETLVAINRLSERDLDPLREAAQIALDTADEYESKRSAVARLYAKAARLWERSEQASGEQTVKESAAWAIEQLTGLDLEAGRQDRAVKLLLDGARLPFDAESSRVMWIRAANILIEQGEHSRAIEIYSRVVEETPDDLESIQQLESLLKKHDRTHELLILLRRELKLIESPERRLELRLEIARLVGLVEGRDERVQSLRANLEEETGHAASIEALCEILNEKARYSTLAELLSEQAKKLEDESKMERAAQLWALVADLSEKNLSDSEQAVFAHTRVVELDCMSSSLDALARLSLERGAPAEAATWLRRRLLDTEDPAKRVMVMLRLARAQIQASQQDRAITTLETAFGDAPRNAEVRKLLMNQYRASEDWEPLAKTLAASTEYVSDESTILNYAREAADIYFRKLDKPELVVPVLERALPLDPEDRALRGMLAEGLRITDRLEEARELVVGLLEDFGRRRSVERAATHLLLARIAHAEESTDEALEQLDMASKMDSQNVEIWQTLAELAREAGQLEKAERAYRTLLLIVRRGQPNTEGAQVGSSEVLMELSRIAADQGQDDKAEELCESAFEALSKIDGEAKRLQAKLLEWERHDLLERAFETRLEHLKTPRKLAVVYSEYADVLADSLERPEDAFNARLRAVEHAPGSPPLHDTAYEAATELGQLDKFTEKLETLFENTRRDSDAHVRCELLLRLCNVMLTGEEDLERAHEYLTQAEATGVREVDVWRAGAKLAGARGDTEEQMRLLTNLSSMGEEEVETETRADVFYRMAEIQLAVEETHDEGLESLGRALSEDSRNARAGNILRRACEAYDPSDELLSLYDQVARQAGDDQMLLDYLERRAARADATPEQIREGAELATRLEDPERAESLMMRAVEIGQEMLDGASRIGWALLGLTSRRMEIGDQAGAVKWLTEASDVADSTEVFELARMLAEHATGPDGDITLAIKLYEKLFERDPSVRDAWETLAAMYANLGDVERFERLAEEVLGSLTRPEDRNALRLKQAELLLATSGRESEAVDVLKDVLLEDAQHEEATSLLADYFERSGNHGELSELLKQRFASAIDNRDADAIGSAALKLGEYLKDDDVDAATDIYRRALEFAPDNRDLLHRVLEVLDPEESKAEQAEIMERILATEEGEAAASLALKTAEIYGALEDEEGVTRTLDLGYRRAPGNDALRERLMRLYQDRGDDLGLAKMLVQMAEEQSDPKARIATLREAATVYRERISDFEAAVRILQEIVEAEPDDSEHRVELAETLAAAGDYSAAIEQISAILDATDDDSLRLDLLKKRADMRAKVGDEDGALVDLEEAFGRHPDAVARDIEAALRRRKAAAFEAGDIGAERTVTMRLAEVLMSQDENDDACSILGQWLGRESEDTEAMQLLLDLLGVDERWDDVVRICGQLVSLETGEAQVNAATRLAVACRNAGTPETARPQLEEVLRSQPESRGIRDELARIYEQTGAQRELAAFLTEDAGFAEDREERADLLKRAGMLFLAANDLDEAAPVLEAALALTPDDGQATAALSDIHLAVGALAEAEALLDKAIAACKTQRSPDLSLLQQRKARIARAQENPTEELNWLKQAVLCDRTNGDVAAELADRAEELEEWDMAVWALKTIALMKTGAPITRAEVFLRQGKISLRRGDQRRAMLFARQALQEDSELVEAKEFLDEIASD